MVDGLRGGFVRQYSELEPCPDSGRAGSGWDDAGRGPLLAGGDGGVRLQVVQETVNTPTGPISVARHGDAKKAAIVTYHDLGLNGLDNFQVRNSRQSLCNASSITARAPSPMSIRLAALLLLGRGDRAQRDLLRVPHHGSRTRGRSSRSARRLQIPVHRGIVRAGAHGSMYIWSLWNSVQNSDRSRDNYYSRSCYAIVSALLQLLLVPLLASSSPGY